MTDKDLSQYLNDPKQFQSKEISGGKDVKEIGSPTPTPKVKESDNQNKLQRTPYDDGGRSR